MDTFVQVSQSMDALGLFMEYAIAFVGTALAIAAGAYLAFKLAPIVPSESNVAKSHERYTDFQARWASVRARRLSLVREVASSDLETRRTDRKKIEADQTDPDLSVADMFWRERVARNVPVPEQSATIAVEGVKMARVIVAAGVLMCLSLFGCSGIVNPDSGRLFADSGEVMGDAGPIEPDADSGMPDAWVDPSVDSGTDAGVVSDRDAGATCASLPIGDVTLPVVSSTCEGPFSLAQSFSGRMRDLGTQCAVNSGSLRVICDHMYYDLPFTVGTLNRSGTVYTSPDDYIGCEGVTYQCHVVFDAITNEHRVDCSLDSSATWCQIVLE